MKTRDENSINECVDQVAMRFFGRKLTNSLQDKVCVNCGEKSEDFRDDKSQREYGITGFCQECQDRILNDERR